VNQFTRSLLLGSGIAFCLFFVVLTISAAAESGFSFLSAISLLIILMIAAGLFGAIRNPPPDE
jgi:hypothetical protein